MPDNKDVDLYAELKATLDKSKEEETLVASDQKPKEVVTPEADTKDVNEPLSDDEISKLSPRAQKRIKDLAGKVKELETPKAAPTTEAPADAPKPNSNSQEYKTAEDFFKAVEDEPSRKLLETFYKVVKNETSNILAPIEQKNNEAKFEESFAQFAKIEGLADYKDDLKKTFLRNPTQSLKSLVGEIVTDLSLNKIKPIEKTPSAPNRGKVDTANLSKDELYSMLDTLRE